jgi:hypothetical protein
MKNKRFIVGFLYAKLWDNGINTITPEILSKWIIELEEKLEDESIQKDISLLDSEHIISGIGRINSQDKEER